MRTIRLLTAAATAAFTLWCTAVAQTYPLPMNLTRYMPVRASSVNESANGAAKYAADGLVCEESRWISDPVNTAHWLEVALPGMFQIGSANVITGAWDTQPVSDFSLQYWTGSAWANIPGATISGNTKTQLQIVFSSPVTTNKVRFYSDQDGSIAVKELAVFPPRADGTGYPIGTEIDIRSGMLPKITASSQQDASFRPYLAYDGYVEWDSRWLSANVTTQHWLEYAFVKEREVAYAHIYTGLGTASAIANFRLQYWDATTSAWADIPGGTVTGNTSTENFLTFTSTIRTTKVRLVSDDDGTIRVKEMVFLPPNGGVGYPRGTGVVFASPPSQRWTGAYNDTDGNPPFSDHFYNIKNRAAGLNLKTAPDGTVTVQAADSSFAQQYNILLNIGTDTYRICNRANEHCLEVAGGSLSAGAVIQEGDYNALPYQQWRLVAADSYYKLVNVYSGLLLTVNGSGSVSGTGLIQQADTSSTAQQWSFPYVTHFPKKGVSPNEISGKILDRYNASHYYNWSLDPFYKGEDADPTYHQPMWWGITNDRLGRNRTEMLVLMRPEWAVSDVPKYLLGFNEPNHTDQSNISVQTALDEWSRAEQVKLPLVGPQHDSAWGNWYTSFFDQADAKGLRIDEGGGHIYPTSSSVNYDAFSSGVTDGYNAQNGRVQWVTEWNWVNWGGAATWTADQLYSVMAETLWRYENNPWVKRYQWFAFNPYWANGAPGALQRDGNLLPLGRLYAAWDGDLNYRTNTWYHIHNRGTHAQLQNSAGAPVNTSINTVDATTNWYLAPAGSGRFYIVSNDGKRLSSDGTTVSLVAAGTTGTAVEWALNPVAASPAHYGWYYLDHPASGRRLDSPGISGSLAMSTDTDNSPRWRFIKPYQPASPPATWMSDASGNWSDGSKWSNGLVPVDGLGYTADFSTLNITADRTVTLDSSRSIGSLKFGDASGPQNWTLASSSGVLTFDGGSGTRPSITVANTLTITAPLAGDQGFDKLGAGTLVLAGNNAVSGIINIGAGIITVQNSNAFGARSTVLQSNGSNGRNNGIQLQGGITIPSGVSFQTSNDGTSGALVPYAIGNLSGNNSINGPINLTSGGGATIIQSDSGALTLAGTISPVAGQTRTLILQGASTAANTVSGTLQNFSETNTLSVTKTGVGTWILSGANSYTGATTLSAGTLVVDGSIDSGSTLTAAGGTVLMGGGTINGNATINGTHSPGYSVGSQTFGSSLSYGSSARLNWELGSNSTAEGSSDKVMAAGAVTVASGAAVDVSLNSSGSSVALNDAFWTQARSWTLLTAPSISGSFSLGNISADSSGRVISNYGVLTLQQSATAVTLIFTPYAPQESWQRTNFGANWNNADLAGDAADPDGDGVSNLLERALGSDPNLSTPDAVPQVAIAGGKLTIFFACNAAATDVTLSVLGADSPSGPWTELARSTAGGPFTVVAPGATVNESDTGVTRSVQVGDIYSVSDPAHPTRFLRTRVQR